MGKLSDFFKMSKQERTGAWMIVALILILIAAVYIERKCSSDDVDSKTQKEITEYVEKAGKNKVKEKKSTKKTTQKSTKDKKEESTTKSKSKTNSKKTTTKAKKTNSTKKQEKSKTKSQQSKSKKPVSAQRMLEPVPQF